MTDTSSLDGTFHSIETLTLWRLIPEAGEKFFCNMDVEIREKGHEETLITFPEGTQRQEIWPRTISERYSILLPDGQELRQVFDRFQGISQLFIVLNKQ